jgi:nitroreductase
MRLDEAIRERKSVRAFKPDPVPKEVLGEILSAAQRAPSWANTQPWEFAIATGDELAEINRAYIEKATAAEPTQPELAAPQGFPEPYDSRRRTVGRGLFEQLGIARDDREKRASWGRQGLTLFGAPVVIYILTGRDFYHQEGGTNVWTVFDCGLIAENIMLLALDHGLGTVPAIQAVMYPEVLRKTLAIADSSLIVLGIGIGYEDESSPVSHFRSSREPLDGITSWHGFG